MCSRCSAQAAAALQLCALEQQTQALKGVMHQDVVEQRHSGMGLLIPMRKPMHKQKLQNTHTNTHTCMEVSH